jgi:hypothetical protein
VDIASEQTGSLFAYAAIVHDLRESIGRDSQQCGDAIGSRPPTAGPSPGPQYVLRLGRMRELLESSWTGAEMWRTK